MLLADQVLLLHESRITFATRNDVTFCIMDIYYLQKPGAVLKNLLTKEILE